METLLRIGLSNAVAALLLALLVVVVACVWRRPAVLHGLWLLVLVKLVTPPLVWLPEPWAVSPDAAPPAEPAPPPGPNAPVSPAVAPASPAVAEPPGDPAPVGSRQPLADDPAAGDTVLAPVPDAEPAPPAAPVPAPVALVAPTAPWWVVAVFGLWLAGSLAWYALALVRLRRFRRLLRYAVPAPESLRQRTQRLAEKLRLRRRPAVWLAPGRIAPMLWAAGGPPRILFPSDLLGRTTPEQQDALLVHELAHLRRRDHWVRWLEFVAAGLYWWNPVLWFARRELREAEELCCDAWVTSTLPGAGKAYAIALLETLDFLSDAPPAAPLLASGVGRVADLKRRLTMIMRGTTPRALGWRGVLTVLGLGALLLPLLPAWARAEPPGRPDDDKKPEVRVFKFVVADDAPPSPEDLEKIKATLKELEAQLAQKQAEVADLAAKVGALRGRLTKAQAPDNDRIVVAVDGQNVKSGDLLKWLYAARVGGAATKVIVIDAATGKIILETNGANPPAGAEKLDLVPQYELKSMKSGDWIFVPRSDPRAAPSPPALTPALPPGAVVPAPPVIARIPASPPTDADKRIDELEQKLKGILEEVEQLRRERMPWEIHSYGPNPLQKLPIIGDLYVKPIPAQAEEQEKELSAARDALRSALIELKTKADADKAQGDAAVEQARAMVQAAQARLEQAAAQKARIEQLVKAGAAPEANLKESQADVATRQADLEVARANLEKSIQERQAREAEVQARLKAAEADRQAAEAKVKQLEEELRKLKEATGGDAPKKP